MRFLSAHRAIPTRVRRLGTLRSYFKAVPPVVTSTQATPELVRECAKIGTAEFVVKPICRNLLLDRHKPILFPPAS